MVVLDDNVHFSQSIIWKLQQQFYSDVGIDAWQGTIPFYATSNAFIANTYASMIMAFMRDYKADHPNGHFKILELGAGCGQFSYLLLQALSKHNDLPDWHYVMSDIDPKITQFWQEHHGFKPYVNSEALSFLLYHTDAGFDAKQLNLNEDSAPLIVIANYFFDSLPADIYAINNGDAYPVTATLSSSSAEVKDFDDVSVKFTIDNASVGPHHVVVAQYADVLLDTKLLYPTASIALLHELQSISANGLFVLATDKAYMHLDELEYLGYPEITAHSGCFSVMVNFDAIARDAYLQNGDAFRSSTRSGIKTAAFSYGFKLNEFSATTATCRQELELFSPADYMNLYRLACKRSDTLTLEESMSLLALSHWDEHLFKQLYQSIFDKLDGADMLTIGYMTDHLPQIADNFYWLPNSQDTIFQIAVIYHTLKHYVEALKYYELSLHYFPDIFGLYFNCGVCAFNLNDKAGALGYFKKASELDPEDKTTQEWLNKLR